jgi:hypothetical protein
LLKGELWNVEKVWDGGIKRDGQRIKIFNLY